MSESENAPAGGGFAHRPGRRTFAEWVLRLVLMLAGLVVAHLGVTLFILPMLGSDPFTIFVQGWSRITGLSVGTCHVIILCILMVAMLLTTKGYVLPGTVVCSFCGGPIIDLFSWLLGGVVNPELAMPLRIVAMLAGCVFLAAGMSMVIKSDAGTGANDLVAVILSDKLRRQFRWTRVGVDICFAIVGFLLWLRFDVGHFFENMSGLLLRSPLGIGTVAAALLIGPLAQFFFPTMGRIANAAVARFIGRQK